MPGTETSKHPIDPYLFLNGLRFHYRSWGGEGRAAVLLHGLSSNARIWDLVGPRLARHFRVFALDQRSHGLTDPAEDGFDFPNIVRDLHAFIDALNLERPVLAGHSWGASTALQYAVAAAGPPPSPGARPPDRGGRAARRSGPAGIVLVDGGFTEMSAAPGMTWEKAEKMLTPPDLDGMPRDVFLDRLKGWLGDLYSEAVANIVLANFEIREDDTLRRRLPIERHMRIARAIYEQKTSDLYARLGCPALLCPAVPPLPRDDYAPHGPTRGYAEQFLARKRDGVARAERVNPLVRIVWFEDTVHDIPLHRPAELAQAIIDFGLTLTD